MLGFFFCFSVCLFVAVFVLVVLFWVPRWCTMGWVWFFSSWASYMIDCNVSLSHYSFMQWCRLDNRASVLDLRVDCQDLEKFSVINRFAKFHSRGQADGPETSSSSDATANAQKTCPQRYVTALPMPRNLPDRVQCLSLWSLINWFFSLLVNFLDIYPSCFSGLLSSYLYAGTCSATTLGMGMREKNGC